MSITKDSRIYIAGHRGLAGSALWRMLQESGYRNLIGRTHAELDLCDRARLDDFLAQEKPEVVFLAAARVGGIHANSTYPAEFIYSNLTIQSNVIDASYRHGVKKLLFLGSSCIYPKYAHQPMSEDQLLAGKLEPTNEPYAIAKIAGIIMCQSYNRQYGTRFVSVMPTNLYGPGDNYHPENSHVLPGLLRRFHEAKLSRLPEVVVWGTGQPRREFLYSDDLARACIFLMENYEENEIVNVGSGVEVTIRELAETIQSVVGFSGRLVFDPSRPDGTPRKLLDVGKLHRLGWRHKIELREGLELAYADFLAHYEDLEPAPASR